MNLGGDALLGYLVIPISIVTWPFRKALANVVMPISSLGRDGLYNGHVVHGYNINR